MKKTLKVLLYFFGSFILLLLLALIFHNAIIQYSLRTLIHNKSEGKVTLNIKDFDLDLFNGTILIIEPEFVMQELYLDDSKNMTLDKINFNKIDIEFLDLKNLIIDRDISARSFFIDKPEIWFTEQGSNSKSSFHPDKLFEVLNHNPGIFKTLQVQIGDIEIKYGSVNISKYTRPHANPGLVDFTIMLHDFNSSASKDTSTYRIFFSEELLFKLKNINRVLESGYSLSVDSAVFSTRKRDIEISGLVFLPGEENLKNNAVGIYAGQLLLTDIGLEEVRGLEDLSLSAVQLKGGRITTYQNSVVSKKDESDTTSKFKTIEKLFYEFLLDTVLIRDVEYYNVESGSDTTIAARKINFMMTGIVIDSGMFEDPLRNFLYEHLQLNTGNFELKKGLPGIELNYNSLSYSNEDRNLKIVGLAIGADSSSTNPDQIDLKLKELEIQGFSLKRFQKQQTQRLTITLNEPEVNIDLVQLSNHQKTNINKPFVPKHLQLEKVVLHNGNINLKVNNQMAFVLRGLNIDVEDFYFPDQVDSSFRYENLTFNYNDLNAQIENNNFQITTGALDFQDGDLILRDIDGGFSTGNEGQSATFDSRFLKLIDFDFDRLIFENELHLSTLQLAEPNVSGTFKIPGNKKTANNTDHKIYQTIPLTMSIGEIIIEKGKIDALIELDIEELKLNTLYNIKLGAISVLKGDSLNILTDQILWDVELNKSNFEFNDHKLNFKFLGTNSNNSTLMIDSLTIGSIPGFNSDQNKMEIVNVDLPFFDITGLDYQLLLKQDSLDFETLRLDKLDVDIILPKPDQSIPKDPNYQIDASQFLFFRYDTISLSQMHLNVEKQGDSTHTIFKLENFNIRHQSSHSSGLNLISNIGFEFDSFSMVDTVSNNYLMIGKGFADSENSTFSISNVEGSNLARSDIRDSENLKASLIFRSSSINFKHIFIRDQLPTKVTVGKLNFADIDIDYLAAENKKKEQGANRFNVKLDLLRRFSKIITKLEVDTTDINDISLLYRKANDTTASLFKIDSVGFIVHDIDIDTSMIGQSDPHLINRLSIDLRGRSHITADSLYEIKTGRLHYNFPNHQFSIDSFYVTPRYSDSLFFEKAVYQTDRLRLFGNRVEINDLDIDQFLSEKIVHIGSIDLRDFNVNMYRDKRDSLRPGLHPKLPREALMGISQKFVVDSIHFVDAYLKYKEFDIKSEKPGEIFFTDFNLKLNNLTNILKENDHETMLKLNVDAKIMGEAGMHVGMFFPLYPDTIVYWMEGKTEEIDLLSLNSMTENLLGLGILQGNGSAEIPLITANDSIAYGSLIFRYKKLKIALYNRKKEKIKKTPLNFLINDLVLRSNNPKRFSRKPREGLSYFKRDTQKGIVNYAWKGVLSGLLSTLGFNNKAQRQERKDLKKTD